MRALVAVVFVAVAGSATALRAQDRTLPFDGGWDLSGDGTAVEPYLGRTALRMRTGRAIRRDVSLEDGTIEFDMAVTPYRSFTYIQFRMASDGEHEELYFRPHKSMLPDAIQYTPVWRGDGNWQLYHGPGGTAPVRFAYDAWLHVRLTLRGRLAALYLGESRDPAIVIPLARDPRAGYVALRAFSAVGGAPDGIPIAAFANVVVRPGHVPLDFPASPAGPTAPDGLVTEWQISPAFVAGDGPVRRPPDALVADRTAWPRFPTEPSGLLVIGRYLDRPRPVGTAIARTVIRATRDELVGLRLGFSDRVTVFLNGQPLFSADESYSHDNPRQEGLIGLWQATAWLPLRAGENEVLVVVSDGFGGWGLMGQVVR